MITTRDHVSQIVSRSELHADVARLKERVDHWTAEYEVDLRAEKDLEQRLGSARPGLETRGKRLQTLQKVQRVLPKVGYGATLVTLPCMSLGGILPSPIMLGVALVGALTIGGSILAIETLKAKLPVKLDSYNAEVDRFNRQSAELDGLRDETRKTRLTLQAARSQYEEKAALESRMVDETSAMADAARGRRPDGAPAIADAADEVVIGSIRLPKLQHER